MPFDIKVCGLTRPEDARLAATLGARYLGFVFYPESPRSVTPGMVHDITKQLPLEVIGVGVFVGEESDHILHVCRHAGLKAAQIHKCPPGSVASLRDFGMQTIEAFSITAKTDWDQVRASQAELVLADHSIPGRPGGTGQPFDWSFPPSPPIRNLVLAGGLNATNVREGVRLFLPAVVDVNSGVEERPGIKSETKLREFFNACRAAQEVSI